ncbi:MAG: type II toxin-antitoxin system death-on-curing family toxin [Acidobacteriia bacterium]|nr:type II toxin-antitoxin system death-on-curing family toxin [Terriglobia bacterium]
MAERIYLTLAEALEMHRQLIEEFGGSPGLRDQGRLEAAMYRPQIGYYNSLAEEAAALMESLANNHAFVDGNKRISFAVTDTFLRVNGFYLKVDSGAAHRFITQAIAKGKFRFGVILEWILSNVKPLPD